MHVRVNGARLYFDLDGLGLVADRSRMRERPTLLRLHDDPGAFDRLMYKPAFSALATIAHVVYLGHRGNGRSKHGDPLSGLSRSGAMTCAASVRRWVSSVRLSLASPMRPATPTIQPS